MTRRDLIWRGAGVALIGIGCAISPLREMTALDFPIALTGVFGFAAAMLGLVLFIQGKRVPIPWRVERSPHRELPAAIHARRCREGSARARSDRPS